MEAQNTRHELSNIYWTALFNLGANTFMMSHLIFFLLFLKMNYLWFMRIFPIFHPIRKSQNLYDVASEFFYDFWKWTICDLWEYFQSAISTVCNPTSWNFWPQFQMGFVYICQEWLSKIGAAHMCSMDQGSLNTTVSWQ